MQFAFLVAAYVVSLLLDVLVIAVVLRTGFRRYAFVLLYAVADFLTTAVEIRPAFGYSTASEEAKKLFANLYWWNEPIMQVAVFALVISLVYIATAQLRPRRVLFIGIAVGTTIFAAATFFVEYAPGPDSWKWMASWTRDLNFGAAILDLGLWAVLISSREKDYRLLMLSGALGLKFSGGAVGQALRGMFPGPYSVTWQTLVGDFIALVNLACLYIWWQALRTPQGKSHSREQANPGKPLQHSAHK